MHSAPRLLFSMSDSQLGKKMVEEEHLYRFLSAYEEVTGEALTLICGGERPDFICERASGRRVGIELTRPRHNYEMAQWDRIWAPDRTMDTCDLISAIYDIVRDKSAKLSEPDWRLPTSTILVVELIDYTFRWPALADGIESDDFADTGFEEIWLSDNSTIEAFGGVRLIGLYPATICGTHQQSSLEGKPFG